MKEGFVFITGATGKLGKALAISLADEDYNLIIHGTNKSKLNELKEILTLANSSIKILSMSLVIDSNLSERAFISCLNSLISSSDVFINGLVLCAMPRPSQTSNHEYISSINTDISSFYLFHQILISQICKKMHQEERDCSIVQISSIYGQVAPDFTIYENTNMWTEPEYAFLKFGMEGLIKYYSSLYSRYNIRLNSIILGGVYNNQPDEFVANYTRKVPMKKMASFQSALGAIKFLLSSESSYTTGSQIYVDGGYCSI